METAFLIGAAMKDAASVYILHALLRLLDAQVLLGPINVVPPHAVAVVKVVISFIPDDVNGHTRLLSKTAPGGALSCFICSSVRTRSAQRAP